MGCSERRPGPITRATPERNGGGSSLFRTPVIARIAVLLSAEAPGTERPEHRRFLDLMLLHSGQDRIEKADSLQNVRPLVQHDALSSLRHRGVGHLGPGW